MGCHQTHGHQTPVFPPLFSCVVVCVLLCSPVFFEIALEFPENSLEFIENPMESIENPLESIENPTQFIAKSMESGLLPDCTLRPPIESLEVKLVSKLY